MPELPTEDIVKSTTTAEELLNDIQIEDGDDKVITETEKDNDVDLLKDDKVVKKDKKSDDEEEDDDEKVDLEDLDDDSIDETKLDIAIPPKRQEILAKYPKLFKDFPELEKSYYREKAYTEVIPTIADAKELVERNDSFSRFENDLFNGQSESVLKSVKDNDSKAFAKIVDDYLPALGRVDSTAQGHVIGTVLNHAVRAMFEEGTRTENETLKAAAVVLNQFTFGTSKAIPDNKFSREPDAPQDNKLNQERQQFAQEKFGSALTDITTSTTNALKSTIDKNIDPRGSMSDYVKRNATREALAYTEKLLADDSRFRLVIDKHWENAAKKGFDRVSMDAIRSTYLGKAKTYLAQAIQKARNEALKGSGRADKDDNKDRKGPIRPGRSASLTNNSGKDKPTIPKGMKSIDFLNSDD